MHTTIYKSFFFIYYILNFPLFVIYFVAQLPLHLKFSFFCYIFCCTITISLKELDLSVGINLYLAT